MHFAVARPQKQGVLNLLDSGVSLSHEGAYKDIHFHSAAVKGQEEMVSMLLLEGANVDMVDCRTSLRLNG